MMQRSAFRLDCSSIIPACGFECSKCLDEMRAIFTETKGVSKFYMEGDGVIVHYDPDEISVKKLMAIFKGLPLSHKRHFVPHLMKP